MDNKCLGNCKECTLLQNKQVDNFCPSRMVQARTFVMATMIKTLSDKIDGLVQIVNDLTNTNIPTTIPTDTILN
jgi:hypothetical protein